MAEPSKELKTWQEEIEIARNDRKKYLVHWNYWEQVYDDNLWGTQSFEKRGRKSTQNSDSQYSQINELESIILNIVPSVHFYAPVFEMRPVYEQYRTSAMIYEVLASVLYNLLGMYENIEEIIIDTLILGGGVHKAGYFYEVETSAYQLGDATAGEPEIHEDMVFSGYVSPIDTLWDYRVKRWQDKRWFAEEIIKPVEEVKKSNIYSNTKDLTGTINSTNDIQTIKREIDRDRKGDLVRLVEIHSLSTGQIITIADNHNKILRKTDDYGIEIFDQLSFTPPRPKRMWGKSIAQSIEEHMIEVAKAQYYMMSHLKRSGLTKWGVEPHLFSPEMVKKLNSSVDGELIAIDGISQGEPLKEIKGSQVGADWFAIKNMLHEQIRMLSGVTMQERGRHEPGVETAFETAKLAQASDKRNRYRIRKVNKFTEDIMDKVLRIVSDNFTPARIFAMVGLPSEMSFMLLPYDKMNLTVKFGSTAIEAREELLQKVAMMGQLAAQAGIQLNPQGYMKLVTEALGLEFRESMLLMGQPQDGGAGTGGIRSPATSSSVQQGGVSGGLPQPPNSSFGQLG